MLFAILTQITFNTELKNLTDRFLINNVLVRLYFTKSVSQEVLQASFNPNLLQTNLS